MLVDALRLGIIKKALLEAASIKEIIVLGTDAESGCVPFDDFLDAGREDIPLPETRVGSCGKGMDDVEIKIVDEEGQSLPAGRQARSSSRYFFRAAHKFPLCKFHVTADPSISEPKNAGNDRAAAASE